MLNGWLDTKEASNERVTTDHVSI